MLIKKILNFKNNKKDLVNYANDVKKSMQKVSEEYAKLVKSHNETHRLYEEKNLSERIYKSVVDISTLLLNVNQTNSNLNQCVKILGNAAKSHRCYIFKNIDRTNYCMQIAEWCDEQVCEPQINNLSLSNFSWDLMPRWKEFFSNKDLIIGKVENFPENEQKILKPQNIKSILAVPIFTNGNWWGFVGFDSIDDRTWLEVEANALVSISNVIGTALKRDYYNDSSIQTKKYLKSVDLTTKSMGVMVWHKDQNGKYITANSKHCIDFFGIEGSIECIEYITNKTDKEIINDIYVKNDIENTFIDICQSSDEYIKKVNKIVHFIEAGVIDGEELLLYVIKTPIFNNNEFIGTSGIAWNITSKSEFIIEQLKRWIYDGHVKEIFKDEDVFCYDVNPKIKECNIFNHLYK